MRWKNIPSTFKTLPRTVNGHHRKTNHAREQKTADAARRRDRSRSHESGPPRHRLDGQEPPCVLRHRRGSGRRRLLRRTRRIPDRQDPGRRHERGRRAAGRRGRAKVGQRRALPPPGTGPAEAAEGNGPVRQPAPGDRVPGPGGGVEPENRTGCRPRYADHPRTDGRRLLRHPPRH